MFRVIRLERSSCIFESLSEAESPHCNSHKSEDHERGSAEITYMAAVRVFFKDR